MDPELKLRLLENVLELVRQREAGERLTVQHLMTPQPCCIGRTTTVLEMVALFHAKQFRHMLVIDDQDRLEGVISDRDVIRCFGPGEYPEREVLAHITAADIMSTDLVTIDVSAPVEMAVERLFDYGINCLPVVAGGRVVGILTSTDLLLLLQVLLGKLTPLSNCDEQELVANDC